MHIRAHGREIFSWFHAKRGEQDGVDEAKVSLVEMAPQTGLPGVIFEPTNRPTTSV